MSRPIKNIVGQKYGWLTIINISQQQTKGKHTNWDCKCICGNIVTRSLKSLSKQTQASCGCKLKKANQTHTKPWNSKLRKCYFSARERCTNSLHLTYKDYGAKGIKFKISSLRELYNHLGNPSSNQTLDRINSQGNYEIGNIRWASLKEQQRNRKDNNWYTYQGKKYIAKDLFDLLSPNCSYDCFRARLKRGWSIDKACL